MAVKNRSVRIEEASNGFVVHTSQTVESKNAEGVIYPDWKNEEHVAKDFAEASKIASDFFMAASVSEE